MKKPKTWCDFDERAAALTDRRNFASLAAVAGNFKVLDKLAGLG